MKKFLALLLALSMCTALLTACGGSANTSEGGAPAASAPADSSAPADASDPAASGDAEMKLATPGKLTMGTNVSFPPYEFYDGETPVGIDVEIATAVAQKLGLELEVVDMDFGSLIAAVQTGKIDISFAGMTVSPERLESVDFSTSYATGIQVVIVPEDSAITSVDDLTAMAENGDDFLIGCQEATTGYIYSSDTLENGGFGEDHVIPYTNGATAVQALTQGKVDCVIIDNEPAKSFVAVNEGLKILDTEYVTEDYAAAIAKDNGALLEAVNAALAELTADGTIQGILDKYITA